MPRASVSESHDVNRVSDVLKLLAYFSCEVASDVALTTQPGLQGSAGRQLWLRTLRLLVREEKKIARRKK